MLVGVKWHLIRVSICIFLLGFPDGSEVKVSACNAGDLGLIPGSGRSPGEGNGNPFQYSCLENPMDGGAWWATVHGVAKSRTWLSDFTFTFTLKYDVEHLFIYFFLSVHLLCEMSVQIFCQLKKKKNWAVFSWSLKTSLYILDINLQDKSHLGLQIKPQKI